METRAGRGWGSGRLRELREQNPGEFYFGCLRELFQCLGCGVLGMYVRLQLMSVVRVIGGSFFFVFLLWYVVAFPLLVLCGLPLRPFDVAP